MMNVQFLKNVFLINSYKPFYKKYNYFNLPIDFPTIIDTAASPVTFTIVRHISKGRSIAKIKAKPASGIPACAKTITNITIPALGTAAVPIEAKVAVKTIPNCAVRLKSNPNACAIKTAATP